MAKMPPSVIGVLRAHAGGLDPVQTEKRQCKQSIVGRP
jgi:hypothetical protein